MKELHIVISLGGSLIKLNKLDYINSLSSLLKELSEKFKLYIVVGGGGLAREYIDSCRKLGGNEYLLDKVGILATRMNANILIASLGDYATQNVFESIEDAIYSLEKKIFVMGGTIPGHTTDAVAVMLGEKVNADKIIIMTNVDGVYDKDPNKNKDAKLLKKISGAQLMEIVSSTSSTAGSKTVVDPLAARLISRAKIPLFVLNGSELENLKKAIEGKEFKGTVVG
ncbi:MAG: UMP kinase [Candidatus Thermoplasmatota archaeon]